MEELRKIAEAYWKVASDDIKKEARIFFDELDIDRSGKVSLHEFLEVMSQERYQGLGIRADLFKKLCRGENESLKFMDVMTLYYIIRSGRPFCNGCDEFIKDIYFCCFKCFHSTNRNYCLCFKCFHAGKYSAHSHNQFVDNFTLLNEKRRELLEPLAERPKKRKRFLWPSKGKQNGPSSSAIVPTGATVPPKEKGRKMAQALEVSGKVLAAANLAATLATTCTIM